MTTPVWRKSSRSSGNADSDCVEVADLGGAVGLRDSKDPDGPRLAVSAYAFQRLVDRLKGDR